VGATFTTQPPTLSIFSGPVGAGNEQIPSCATYLNAQRSSHTFTPVSISMTGFPNFPATSDATAQTEINMVGSVVSALNNYPVSSINLDPSVANAAQWSTFVVPWVVPALGNANGIRVNVNASGPGDLWENGSISTLIASASRDATLNFTNYTFSQLATPLALGNSSVSKPSILTGMNSLHGISTQASINFTDCVFGSSFLVTADAADGSVAPGIANVLSHSSISGTGTVTVVFNNWLDFAYTPTPSGLNTTGWNPLCYGDCNGVPVGN
jgi:hypothetical protein